ncbi:MAG: TlpA family protein disulfide reductase [Candidatus Dormibacteria bacterium]
MLVVVGMAALVAVLVGGARGGGRDGMTPAKVSTDPARFELPRLGGGAPVRLADFRGEPLVANFFASWCTACRGEAPGFVHASGDLRGRVQFLGVDSMETGDGVGFARELGYGRFTLARDSGGRQDSGLHDALGRRGLPITAFYGSDGRLLDVATGALTEEALRSRVADLFGVREAMHP